MVRIIEELKNAPIHKLLLVPSILQNPLLSDYLFVETKEGRVNHICTMKQGIKQSLFVLHWYKRIEVREYARECVFLMDRSGEPISVPENGVISFHVECEVDVRVVSREVGCKLLYMIC